MSDRAGMKMRASARWAVALSCALLTGAAGAATPGDNVSVVRDLASRVGPIVGSALACPEISHPRIQVIADKFRAVIREVSTNEAERDDVSRLFDRYVSDGRGSVSAGRVDCKSADRQLTDLETSISGPSLASVIGPSSANAAPAPAASVAPPPAQPAQTTVALATPTVAPAVPLGTMPAVRGVTDKEIRFGIAAPFSGASRELGRQMKLGIDTAFNRANDAGGVNGRVLRLFAADDGYEPSRTLDAMKQLYDKDKVFGFIGNVGTPTSAVAMPFALQRRTLFYGAFTGANILRNEIGRAHV